MIIRQLPRCGNGGRRSSVACPANTPVSGNGSVSRMRSLGLGVMLALVMAGLYASVAQAAGPTVMATFSCSAVTYTFTGFPNAPDNTVTETIKVNGAVVYKGTFTFNGPSGSNTVKISAPAGHDKILADAHWDTNGVRGEKDIKATGGLTCPETEPEKPTVMATFSCSAVTYTFTGFPNAPDNTVTETIKVNGAVVYKGTFTFNGPSGSNTVKISAPAGHDKILADAHWDTNGVRGEKDIKATGGITCEAEPKPGFSIEKLQEIAGSGEGFTTSELQAVEGQTVDYEIIVTNTGGVPLTFSEFSDENCENLKPGSSSLAPGESTTYTCDHVLTTSGSYCNEASDTGSEGTGTQTSGQVCVDVPPEPKPGFSIEKLQEIEGSGEGFATSELQAVEGQTVDYEIIVTNMGGVPLTFSEFSDENCENLKPGSSSLAPGESTTYTCDHVLTSTDCSSGAYANEASVTGDEGTGTETSNKVVVKAERGKGE
jgi:hypothetical protein